MSDNKLSDNEIIKALECHQFAYDPYMQSVIEHALDLINRQKAEIERLNSVYKEKIESVNSDAKELIEQYQHKAIKEFAERLCADRMSNDPVVIAVKCELKEMVGEDK